MCRLSPARHLSLLIALCWLYPGAARPQGSPIAAASPARMNAGRAVTELPLRPERTVSFNTDEGSWISLDVSPDGASIVFDLLGDLYLLPMSGGVARRITSGMAFDAQPRYSPDGRTILFVSDRSGAENLWVTDANGDHPRQLTHEQGVGFTSPAWTPDGDSIVVARTATGFFSSMYELALYDASGQSARVIQGGPTQRGFNALGPAFGKDPRFVYHAGKFGEYTQNPTRWMLYRTDRQTGRRWLASRLSLGMRPSLSPDGRWMVFAARRDAETGLRLQDMTTGEERWLKFPVQRDDQESRYTRDLMPGSAFTPDSKALITSFAGKFWRLSIPTGEATAIPFTARVEQSLGPRVYFTRRLLDGPLSVRQIRDARLSPDGTQLAFTALDRIWVMAYPSGTPRRLTRMEIGEFHPAWSPDGKSIAYVTWSDTLGGNVYVARADSARASARLTTTNAYYSRPAYAPDGRRIAFFKSNRQEQLDNEFPGRPPRAGLLQWIAADGGVPNTIASGEGLGAPHFTSAHPDWIYFYGGNEGLVAMRFDGSGRHTVLKVTGYKEPDEAALPATDVQISPDGSHALALVSLGGSQDAQAFVIDLASADSTAPLVSVTDSAVPVLPTYRLSTFGASFIGWAGGGRYATFTVGRTLFRADLRRIEARRLPTSGGTAPTPEARSTRRPLETESVDITLRFPRRGAVGTLALRGARLITMRGSEVIEQGDLIIKDNRLVAVGRSGDLHIPPEATVVDVSGKTIIPGLIDLHVHDWPAADIHRTQPWQYLAYLAYGVTTTRDPGYNGTDFLSYADAVEAGQMLGPRIFSTGEPISFTRSNLTSLDETRRRLRLYSEYLHTGMVKQYLVGDRIRRQWFIMAAREQGLMATTEGGFDLKLNLTMLLDGYTGQEHALPVVPLYKDVVQLVAQSGIYYTPTLLYTHGGPMAYEYFYSKYDVHGDPKVRRFMPHSEVDFRSRSGERFADDAYPFPKIAKVAADILAAGGKVGLGGHSMLTGLGSHWELWALESGGMSRHDALRAATLTGAEALGVAQDLGSLEVGKLADLVVLDENPLADIRNSNTIRYVVKNGEMFEGQTLDQQWPVRRALPKQSWWDDDLLPVERIPSPARR